MLLLLDFFNQYFQLQMFPKDRAFDTGSEIKVRAIGEGIKTGSPNDSQHDGMLDNRIIVHIHNICVVSQRRHGAHNLYQALPLTFTLTFNRL